MEKLKTNFIIINLKKYLISIASLVFVIMLVLYSESNIEAAKNGLMLWVNSVIPSLFPFFVATEILCSTNLVNLAGRFLQKPIKKIFNVPGEGAIALIMGIISGYPTGAKIAVNFREENICSKEEAERLLAFTNNSGPLFIIGTVGVTLFGNVKIGYMMLVSHIISCLIVGVIFRNWKKKKERRNILLKNEKRQIISKNIGEILGNSIKKSIITILNIGGFIVIFSVIISILNENNFFDIVESFCNMLNIPDGIGTGVISGIIELTNGLNKISNSGICNLTIILSSFLIGLGGISVLLQVYSVISKSDLSIKPYIYGKMLQSTISVVLTFLILQL